MNKLSFIIKYKSFPIDPIELVNKDIIIFIILIRIQIHIKIINIFFTICFLQSIKIKLSMQIIEIINNKNDSIKPIFLIAKNPANKYIKKSINKIIFIM